MRKGSTIQLMSMLEYISTHVHARVYFNSQKTRNENKNETKCFADTFQVFRKIDFFWHTIKMLNQRFNHFLKFETFSKVYTQIGKTSTFQWLLESTILTISLLTLFCGLLCPQGKVTRIISYRSVSHRL